ncbi:RING finger and WD repeat domain-containing protein 3, partial [Coemansia thaxteri]
LFSGAHDEVVPQLDSEVERVAKRRCVSAGQDTRDNEEGGSTSRARLPPAPGRLTASASERGSEDGEHAGAAIRPRLVSGGASHMSLDTNDSARSFAIVDGGSDDDDDDFMVRAVTVAAAPTAEPTTASDEAGEAGDSNTCPICLSAWGISGRHRVVSLKCGHLFGQSCIRKWLLRGSQVQGRRGSAARGTCPDCKQAAVARDIRVVFARAVTAADDAELERVRGDRRRLEQEVCTLRTEATEYRMRHQMLSSEVVRLRAELDEGFKRSQWAELEIAGLRRRLAKEGGPSGPEGGPGDGPGGGPSGLGGGLGSELGNGVSDRGSDLGSDIDSDLDGDPGSNLDGGPSSDAHVPLVRLRATVAVAGAAQAAQVAAFDPAERAVYASRSSAGGRHSLARIDVSVGVVAEVAAALHAQRIRGAEVGAQRLVLTASQDQTAALTAASGGHVAARLALGAPGWACAWDAVSPHVCYVGAGGTRGSAVLGFDVRAPKAPLVTWSGLAHAVGHSPVHAIAAVPTPRGSRLLVANANHVYALPPSPAGAWAQLSPAAAPRRACFSLSYDAATRCAAASFRVHGEDAQHAVHELYSVPEEPPLSGDPPLPWRLAQSLPTDSPQIRLARSTVFSYVPPAAAASRRVALFCAPHEASRSVSAWTVGCPPPAAPLTLADARPPEDIVDVRGCQWPGAQALTLLATLSNTTMRLYDVR